MSGPEKRPVSDGYEISSPDVLVAKPVVSVLLMAFNHANHFAEAVESVVSQHTNIPIELLIGEDCSTDGTSQLALQYQTRFPEVIRVITADRNVGATRNYRRLLLAARGEFIAYLDGDDYWLPGKIDRQLEALREDPGLVAAYANAITVAPDGTLSGVFNDLGDRKLDLAFLLREGNLLNNSSIMFRSEMRESILAIPGTFIDYMIHLTLAGHGPVTHIGSPLVAYRWNAAGSMVSSSGERVRQLYWEAITSVPRARVSDHDFASGVANFMRRVLFRSISGRSWSPVRTWWPIVSSASPYGPLKTATMVLDSSIRVGTKMILARLRGFLAEGRSTVLYRS